MILLGFLIKNNHYKPVNAILTIFAKAYIFRCSRQDRMPNILQLQINMTLIKLGDYGKQSLIIYNFIPFNLSLFLVLSLPILSINQTQNLFLNDMQCNKYAHEKMESLLSLFNI